MNRPRVLSLERTPYAVEASVRTRSGSITVAVFADGIVWHGRDWNAFAPEERREIEQVVRRSLRQAIRRRGPRKIQRRPTECAPIPAGGCHR